MANQVTFTGNIGPGNAVTSLVFSNVTDLRFDYLHGVAIITYNLANGSQRIQSVQLTGITTITDTISGANHTVAMS